MSKKLIGVALLLGVAVYYFTPKKSNTSQQNQSATNNQGQQPGTGNDTGSNATPAPVTFTKGDFVMYNGKKYKIATMTRNGKMASLLPEPYTTTEAFMAAITVNTELLTKV